MAEKQSVRVTVTVETAAGRPEVFTFSCDRASGELLRKSLSRGDVAALDFRFQQPKAGRVAAFSGPTSARPR